MSNNENESDAPDKGGTEVLKAFRLYLLLLVASTALNGSYAYYRFTGDPHAGDTHQAVTAHDVPRAESTAEGSHEQPPSHTIIQIFLVVSIAVFWFNTFRTAVRIRERGRTLEGSSLVVRIIRWLARHNAKLILGLLACLPAAAFAVGMHDAYQPAVFVMALVAIFVAAEHYAGLEELEGGLEELEGKQRVHVRGLRRTLRSLRKVSDDVQVQLETLRSLQDTLRSLQKVSDAVEVQLGVVASVLDETERKEPIYLSYRGADQRIDAVIRHWDIDSQWWTLDNENAWEDYLSREKDTLFSVLSDGERQPKVQFVTDLPLPMSAKWKEQKRTGQLFRSLLGLTWQLVIFDEVMKRRRETRSQRSEVPYMRARIAPAEAWVHIVDDRLLFELSGDLLRPRVTMDPTSANARSRVDAMRTQIQEWASGAGSATEYVLSTLRLQAFTLLSSESQAVSTNVLRTVLRELGMETWLNEGFYKEYKRNIDDESEKLCLKVFERFIRCRCNHDGLAVLSSGKIATEPHLYELSYEAL